MVSLTIAVGCFAASGDSESRPIPRACRVLVVDDERDTVLTLMALLRAEGYETQGAYDGHSALRELEQFDPDELLSRVTGFNHFLVKPCDPKRLLQILSGITVSPK
jgi:CheY-like chemotaxis protein